MRTRRRLLAVLLLMLSLSALSATALVVRDPSGRTAGAHETRTATVSGTPTAAPAQGIQYDSGGAPSGGPHAMARIPTAPEYMVLIVLDGARPDYFTVPNIPHVQSLISNGTQYTNAWAGILESETPSGHAAIATGSQPREDGILSFDWANSDNIPVNLFSEQGVRAGALEKILRKASAPTIAGQVHKQIPSARVVALSGYKYYAADAIGGPSADAIMYYTDLPGGKFGPTGIPGHMPPASVLNAPGLVLPSRGYGLGVGNHMAMKLAGTSFAKMHQKVTLINLPEFDWPLGHVDGASRDQKDLGTLMRGFDADLAALEDTYRKAGVLDKTLFVLTADHGFSLIDHKISHQLINNIVAQAGTRIIRDTYHTAAYVWVKDETKTARVAALLAAKQNPYIQSVYFRSMGAHGPYYTRATGADLFRAAGVEAANQYLLQTFSGPNSPDVVVFLKEHSMFVAGSESSWKGDHGGAAWQSQHLPLILSGPGVRKGYTSIYPAPLMDIAPTVLRLMNIPFTGMQGIPLVDALQASSAAEQAAQQAQGSTIWPVISSLKAESRLELRAGQ
ncbi:MAG TPA: alkaline phosphatase family protein [Chloroflexota bacterium]